ncbi:hypothetical protein JXA63_03035 [Candidatus Woesebacteria bacterium]|nr:hypothetical protein [Candidatus Woesebacteria bacterium]
MKKLVIFLFIFIALTYLYKIPFEVHAEVLGTSVTVIESPIDIKNIETESMGQGSAISASINLKSKSSDPENIDRVELIISTLDGSVVQKDNVDISENINPLKDHTFNIEIPSSLVAGEYVGFYKLYSEDMLLGQSKTLITIPKPIPQVLGAATENNINILFIAIGVSAVLLLVSLVILLKNPSWINKKINFGWSDLFFLITGLSAFGLGFCIGYFSTKYYLL